MRERDRTVIKYVFLEQIVQKLFGSVKHVLNSKVRPGVSFLIALIESRRVEQTEGLLLHEQQV